MLFSSVVFLFKFLPVVLIGHFVLRNNLRNAYILLASLLFYYWGETTGVLIMLTSIAINYSFGLLIGQSDAPKKRKIFLIIGVGLNLCLLFFYKYFYFIINAVDLPIYVGVIGLPLGISFFTFQGISYVVDVFRKEVDANKNPLNIALYISLFPQLIAGPIVRYTDISNQIKARTVGSFQFVSGLKKFIRGFFKKVVIANNVGMIADLIMIKSNVYDVPFTMAWLGVLAFTLQIYFDFSGYSDMAIGLGRMMGFNFKENFKHPYLSFSIKEFWRKWHISLSSWFRDYLYIPLGGNRKGTRRIVFNLLIVFFLTGLWHGASWNFIVWGMIHGVFLIAERFLVFKFKFPSIFRYSYMLLVVMSSWVYFKIEDLESANIYLSKMFIIQHGGNDYYSLLFMNNYLVTIFIIAVAFAFPIRRILKLRFKTIYRRQYVHYLNSIFYLLVFCFTIIELSISNYNPFIYFRF